MTNTTNALTILTPREIAPIQRYGDWLTQRIATVLAARFSHRNGDGTMFAPRIAESITFPPYYHLVVVDPQALWHFSTAQLTSEDTLAALTGAAQRLVRPITRVPDESGRVRHGLAYAILLRDLPHPNDVAQLPRAVRLELNDDTARNALRVPLGVSARGAEWRTLAEVGHALIVGASGAGKSTWIHSALAALLSQNTPDVLRVVLIDPKQSEFTLWANVPHLYDEMAYTPEQAERVLDAVVAEMNRRGDLLASALARDVRAYNARADASARLPFILIVIDECLDLVLNDGGVTRPLKTIAIRGRSAGVILWAATQHASAVAGLPRVVNVNLATRIVFRVSDASAAQAAGCAGAHNIPRTIPGRALVRLSDEPIPMQAYYLPDDDLRAVARALGARNDVPASASPLTVTERALLEWSARENDGVLTIADIQARGGVGQREARRIAEQLEARGWLAKDRAADNRRRITAATIGALGLGLGLSD